MKSLKIIRFAFSLATALFFSTSVMADSDDLIIRKYGDSEGPAAFSSSWKFSEDFNSLIDSYSSFIFRTNKSLKIEQVNFVIEVNSFGEIVGFELINAADKGLKERLDYVVRQLPVCQPAEGAATYKPEKFEIIIKK